MTINSRFTAEVITVLRKEITVVTKLITELRKEIPGVIRTSPHFFAEGSNIVEPHPWGPIDFPIFRVP